MIGAILWNIVFILLKMKLAEALIYLLAFPFIVHSGTNCEQIIMLFGIIATTADEMAPASPWPFSPKKEPHV